MIESYSEYLEYLESDRLSLRQVKTLKATMFDDIWKYQRLLRKLEYLVNCRKNRINILTSALRLRRLERLLGYSIPLNVFGPGLSIAHRGTIIVNSGARVGANCRLHACVNIGAKADKGNATPQIGENCYIGPGAKIFGNIILGDNMVIGANAVVNKSFPEGNCTIAGIPAKKISEKTSFGIIIRGYKPS